MKRKVNDNTPRFGQGGLKEIEYLGELPFVIGPFVTPKIYRFRQGKNPRFVDLRDLPKMTDVVGRDKLRDVNAKEEKKPARRYTKPEPEKKDEEVANDND